MNRWLLPFALMAVALVAGCGDSGSSAGDYKVTVTNITENQALSAPAAVLHTNGYSGWTAGSAASVGLARLAEAGYTPAFLSDADDSQAVKATEEVPGPILPGGSASVTLSGLQDDDLRVTLATMLVNTNDAFAGVNDYQVGTMAVGETVSLMATVYDAGTEPNTETAATVPGPAAGGEGYNVAGGDTGFVSVHPGVVTADDGLATSALDQSHRFNGPAAVVTIERTK